MLYENVENYFATLNPIAERISHDINKVKADSKVVWNDLSYNEREKLIDRTIITPEVVQKYRHLLGDLKEERSCKFPCGNKISCDETTGATWRDEHSAPFSWRSRSMLALCKSSKCLPANPVLNVAHVVRKSSATASTCAPSPDCQQENLNFNTFCTKLKSIPSKAFTSLDERGFLLKLTSGAVGKIQNTIRYIGGKNGPITGEGDVLVSGSGAVIVPAQTDKTNCSPVKKPKGPPPPPPPRVRLCSKPTESEDPATSPMLDDESQEYFSGEPEEAESRVDRKSDSEIGGLADTPTDSTDLVPKTGFDFLDDW